MLTREQEIECERRAASALLHVPVYSWTTDYMSVPGFVCVSSTCPSGTRTAEGTTATYETPHVGMAPLGYIMDGVLDPDPKPVRREWWQSAVARVARACDTIADAPMPPGDRDRPARVVEYAAELREHIAECTATLDSIAPIATECRAWVDAQEPAAPRDLGRLMTDETRAALLFDLRTADTALTAALARLGYSSEYDYRHDRLRDELDSAIGDVRDAIKAVEPSR